MTRRMDPDDCILYKFCFDFVLNVALIIFGFIANWISFYIMWPDRKKSAHRLLLLSLSVYDNCVLIIWFLQKSMPAFCEYTGIGKAFIKMYRKQYYPFLWPLGSVFHMASTMTILFVTLQRFVAICYPHKASSMASVRIARIQIAFCALFSLIFCLPRFLERKVQNGKVVKMLANYPVYEYVYKVCLYYVLIYVVPLAAICYMTYRLMKSLREADTKRKHMIQIAGELSIPCCCCMSKVT